MDQEVIEALSSQSAVSLAQELVLLRQQIRDPQEMIAVSMLL